MFVNHYVVLSRVFLYFSHTMHAGYVLGYGTIDDLTMTNWLIKCYDSNQNRPYVQW